MDQQSLIEKLQEKVTSIEQEILDNAARERDAIIADADTHAAAMEQEVHDRVKSHSDQLLERKYNAVRFRANLRRYELKAHAIDEVWRDAAEIVRGIAASPEYPEMLEHLFMECLGEAPEGSTVRVSPEDAGRARDLVKRSKRRFDVVETPGISRGVEFRWPGGEAALINTLEHRLTRLREGGNAAISAILFGERTA